MQRVLIGIAAILLAAGLGVVAGVAAKGADHSAFPSSGAIPSYLATVGIDDVASAGPQAFVIDIPINNTIYPPDLIPPQFACATRSFSARRRNRSRLGLPAKRCRLGRSTRRSRLCTAGAHARAGRRSHLASQPEDLGGNQEALRQPAREGRDYWIREPAS